MSYWYNKKKEITIGIRELFQKIEQIKIKNSKTIANKIKYRLYYSNKKIKEKRYAMKIVIIGGVAGGATTVTRLRRLKEDAQIIMIERGKHISFANCGLPYYIGDVIQEKQDLLLQTPESFKERFNVDVRVCQELIQINRKEKKVIIRK